MSIGDRRLGQISAERHSLVSDALRYYCVVTSDDPFEASKQDDAFQIRVKNWFEDAVVDFYFETTLDFLRKNGVSLVHMGQRLQRTDSGLLHKYIKGDKQGKKTRPSLKTMFLTFAAFDIEWPKRALPRGREAVEYGIKMGVWRVKEQVLGIDCPRPSSEDLAIVWESSNLPEWECAVSAGTADDQERAAKTIRRNVRGITGFPCKAPASRIMQTHFDWYESYVIFMATVPYDWRW